MVLEYQGFVNQGTRFGPLRMKCMVHESYETRLSATFDSGWTRPQGSAVPGSLNGPARLIRRGVAYLRISF